MTRSTKTVKEHLEVSDRLAEQLKQSDALVKKVRGELVVARDSLEWLLKFAPHPSIKSDVGCGLRTNLKLSSDVRSISMQDVIDKSISRISAILGDRA